ncbi:MAG: tyrosine-type recombinase/integrase [Bacteroidales bacterium]|jgi:integrase/recombinase XerD
MFYIKFSDKYESYFNYLKQKGRKAKTIREQRRYLYDIFPHEIQNKRLKSIKRADTALLEEAGRNHGEHGATRAIVYFRRYCDFLQLECNIRLPIDWRDIKVPVVRTKEQPVFEDYELATLFKIMETMESGSVHGRRMSWTMQAFFETLFGTGLRLHEALQLKRCQFAEIKDIGKTKVIRKGNKEREITFSDRAIEKLGSYLEKRNDISEAMFVNSCGEPLIASTAKSHFQRFRKKLRDEGYPEIANKLKSHTFRRTLATYLLENGADIKTVQSVMDHESERTTIKHYIKVNKRRAQVIHRSILSKIPFEELANRYKEVNGRALVRTTPNGGQWMSLDENTSKELSNLMKPDLHFSEENKNSLLKIYLTLERMFK